MPKNSTWMRIGGFLCSAEFVGKNQMNKRVLLKNLVKAEERIAPKERNHDEAVNTAIGCFGILCQAGHEV